MSPLARVLVVDDSATMRCLVSERLAKDPRIEVIGTARDPYDARQKVKDLNPSVITLDIEMPKMDGLAFLEKIMRLRPTPVIMLSSLTRPGASATLRALELGAFDCVAKPTAGDRSGLERLNDLVVAASRTQRHLATRTAEAPVQAAAPERGTPELVGIGASTGGVEALIGLVAGLAPDGPPVAIVQHMPANFTASFAARLDRASPATVVEAVHLAPLERGHVYLAPGDRHLKILRDMRGDLVCHLEESDPVQGHRPSVDVLFHSLAALKRPGLVGIILTGLGRDGAAGLKAMREGGAHTVGQDEASSLVYGMPRAAFEAGAVCRQAPLSRILQAAFARPVVAAR